MKKKLFLCTALALAGCSTAPGSSDLENFLEPKFSSCKNVKVIDIKKIDGYEEDGYYHVEFKYGIEVTDKKKLRELKNTLNEEIEHEAKASIAYKERGQVFQKIKSEISALHANNFPRREKFDEKYPNLPQQERNDLFEQALANWPPAEIKKKEQELELYEENFHEQWGKYKYRIFGSAGNVANNFYFEGCSHAATKFMRGLISAPASAVQSHNDQTRWFDEYDIQMTAKVPMRKTENGWRALSDG